MKNNRIESIDILRGLVIILMALDHVRHFYSNSSFSPVDLTNTTPELFLTRWITHFCAPVFVFLTGISAYLYGVKLNNRLLLSKFLLTRGLWLIFVELTIINFSWYLSFDFVVQVLWVLGLSMIILAALIWLPKILIGMLALIFLFAHNIFDGMELSFNFHFANAIWRILHQQGSAGPLYVAYPLIPWFSVMALGYLIGPIFYIDKIKRNRYLLILGTSTIILFLILRTLNIYGDPLTWEVQTRGGIFTILSFINTTKYPASLLFILMTLGPALLLLALFENYSSRLYGFILNFGKVPMFFYVIHVPVIHLSAVVLSFINYGSLYAWPSADKNLTTIYLAWIIIIVVLYPLCAKFTEIKRNKKEWWLSYL